MKRLIPTTLLFPALLAACGEKTVQTPDAYNLSGTLYGDWGTSPNLRLALVGTGLPDIFTNESTREQVMVPAGEGRRFGFDLPRFPDIVGIYQVIAFNDANNNAKYDIGETFARNRLWLIFSPKDATTPAIKIPANFPWAADEEAIPSMTVKSGWNVYDRAQQLSSSNPRPGSKITGYDLY